MPRFPLMRLALLACAYLSSLPLPLLSAPSNQRPPPNILLLTSDGLGFSDLGCFGGEAETPCLDWLSERGIRFSQAYHAGDNASTQRALLSGFYPSHIQREPVSAPAPVPTSPPWLRYLPETLRAAGYRSYHSGTWHLEASPRDLFFERFYALLDTDRYFSPERHFLDGVEIPQPSEDYYATSAIADHAIAFLQEHQTAQPKAPFFACVAFSAPHFPLQAPLPDVLPYRNRFDAGTEVLRQDRLQRLLSFGLLMSADLPAPTQPAKAWPELSPPEKDAFRSRMEIHTAMISRMDREIGRILDQLVAMQQWDNTLVLFLSTAGPSAEHVIRGNGHTPNAPAGSASSYLCLGAQGVSVANTPLRYSRNSTHEGGIAAPFIVHWPNGFKARGEIREQPIHAIDIAPTLFRNAGLARPKTQAASPGPTSDGVDLTATLRENKEIPPRALWWNHQGNRAIRLGDWKWVSQKEQSPELYHVKTDRAEVLDVAVANQERLIEMGNQWKRLQERFEKDLGAVPSVSPVRADR